MPSSIEALIIFILLAIPGLVMSTVLKARYPGFYYYHKQKQSPSEEIVTFVFFGLIIDILIITCFWPLLKWTPLSKHFLLLISNPIPNSIDEFFIIFVNIALSMLITIILTIFFSCLVSEILVRILPVTLRPKISDIYKLKILQQKHKKPNWLLVTLENGDRYLGLVSSMQLLENEFGEMELTLEHTYCERAGKDIRENIGKVTLLSKRIQAIRVYE
ncbi:MAG: DUF6338 family protein [Chloroflexota bacterium]